METSNVAEEEGLAWKRVDPLTADGSIALI